MGLVFDRFTANKGQLRGCKQCNADQPYLYKDLLALIGYGTVVEMKSIFFRSASKFNEGPKKIQF